MNITTRSNADSVCTLTVEGRMDTLTAQELENKIKACAEDCDKMILDLSGVDYISSSGLRVIVLTHRIMSEKGGLVLKGLNKNVRSVISMTGFDNVLKIEE